MSSGSAFLASAMGLGLCASIACGDDLADGTGGGGTDSGNGGATPDHQVVYEGGATDEAFVELIALTPTEDPAEHATFTAPEDGATFADDALPAFTWVLPRHGDPVNGRAYALTFRGADGAIALEVFTLLETYTPTAEAWAPVAAADDPVQVELVSALFESNRVQQGGGPFLGDVLSLTVD